MLAGRHYEKTVSIARFMNHVDVARSFRAVSGNEPRPDIIIASYPTEELCRAMLDYAEPLDIPVIIDTRDFWPDIFSEMFPGPTKILSRIVFSWLEKNARATLARATALSGMTLSAMQWAIKKANRSITPDDFWFPFTYQLKSGNQAPRDKKLNNPGVHACFLGTISHRSNLELAIDAFRLLEQRGVDARLSICGVGQELNNLQLRANKSPNIHFLGWLNAQELSALTRECDFGILPYVRADFQMSLPNKFVEYLAFGMAVISPTRGEIEAFLERHKCGFHIENDPVILADLITKLIQYPKLISDARTHAHEAFDTCFNEDKVFLEVEARLAELVSRNNS